MAIELDEWLTSNPEAPDLEEAPEGWHKFFDSFTICGEGECIKTLFTIYAPGKPQTGKCRFGSMGEGGLARLAVGSGLSFHVG